MIRILSLLLSLSFAQGILADEAAKLTALEQFEEQKAAILEDLSTDRVYKVMAGKDKNLVKDALERMSATLAENEEIDQLTPDEKARLYNDQELVNTVLTMAENDNRRVCSRRHRVGTHFKTTHCETVAERRERQEQDRRAIELLRDSMGTLPKGG